MGIYSGALTITTVSNKELNRQFRVLRQSLSLHAIMRDRYTTWALIIDLLLLVCAVVFCATTFVRDDVLSSIGFSAKDIRFVLGIASITAFFASLVALRVDWKGKSARHRDAGDRLSRVLSMFRQYRQEDDTWPNNRSNELHQSYWEAMNNVVAIPEKSFVRLKGRYLRKVEISKMSDTAPGAPLWILRLVLLARSIKTTRRNN